MSRAHVSLAPGEPDQVPRLQAFRTEHPDVVIGTTGPAGAWQARIPEENGESIITRYLLKDLLDKVDEIVPPAAESSREALARALRDRRRALGWSQGRLAAELNSASGHPTLTREDISRWEHGKRVPGPFWIRQLAAVLQAAQRTPAAAACPQRRPRSPVTGSVRCPAGARKGSR